MQMNHTLALAIVILLLAATGRGQSQTNQVMLRIEALECCAITTGVCVAESITIGPVEICCTNGAVTIDKGITLDAASREFWKTLEKEYGGMFPANDIRKLAASGEICKALGRHFWRPGRPGEGEGSISGNAWYADYHPGTTYRTCAICGICESKSEGNWK